MNIFVTFASSNFKDVASRIINEAMSIGYFDKAYSIDETQLTSELLESETFHVKKGYGLYSWKPDTIWQALEKAAPNDIIVYCDAGCTLQKSKEWDEYFRLMESNDALGFRIQQRNFNWTRKSVFDFFKTEIHIDWKNGFQYGANALIVKNSEMGKAFISEWRSIMIHRLDLCGDVHPEEKKLEDERFISNRYDQTILTSLLFKYSEIGNIKSIWEHFEGYDPFREQAVIATRSRKGRENYNAQSLKHVLWRLYKDNVMYPYFNVKYKEVLL